MSTARATTASDRRHPRPLVGWSAMALIWLMVTLAMLDRGIIALMVDPLKRDLHLTDLQIGTLQGLAFAIFYCLGSVPIGYLGDRYSRRWVFYAGITIWSAATALCGLAQNFTQLFLARLGVGLGESSLSPSSYAMIPDLFPPHRHAVVIGMLAAASSVGASISLILGGFLIEWAAGFAPGLGLAGWQLVFLIAGLTGLALAPLIFLVPKVVDRRQQAEARQPLPGYARWLRANAGYLLTLILAVGFHAVVATGVAAWTPAFIARRFLLDAKAIGLTFGPLIGICGFVGAAGSGWLIDMLHGRGIRNVHVGYILLNSLVMIGAGIAAFTLVSGYAVFLCLLALILTLMPVTGVAMAHLQMVTPDLYRGRNTAVFMVGISVSSMVLGPISVAYATEHVFGGPEHVGAGLATALTIFPLLSVIACLASIRPAARALAARTDVASATGGRPSASSAPHPAG